MVKRNEQNAALIISTKANASGICVLELRKEPANENMPVNNMTPAPITALVVAGVWGKILMVFA